MRQYLRFKRAHALVASARVSYQQVWLSLSLYPHFPESIE